MLRSPRVLFGLTLAALCLPASGRAQERTVISKEISVGRSEAAMRLEFSSGDPLEISLRSGTVFIDDEAAGAFQAGDDLDAAWRALLGEAVALDDGPLSRRLREWAPPTELKGDRLELANTIDHALEDALTVPAAPAVPNARALDVSVGGRGQDALVRALLGHASLLSGLQDVLADAGGKLKLHVDEDVEVAAGETIDGTLVVVQGDVRIEGEVTGSVVVVDGTLELADGSRVGGDVRLADATLSRDGGTVAGEVVNVESDAGNDETRIRNRLRDEIRSEIRSEMRGDRGRNRGFNPFRNIFRAIGGVIENVVSILVMALIGMGVVAFAPRNLDTVAEAARRAPGRAAMVGLAGTFLLIPVWVLGAVALAVSIVGIPVMIAWLPLFPVAAVAAAILGYLAVARNVGEWLSETGYRYTDLIRKSNPVYTITGGLVGLGAFFLAANVLRLVPFFGFFRGLLDVVGVIVTVAAMLIGFGAVLLTRAGRRREYGPIDFDEAWERAVDADIDIDATPTSDAGTGAGGPTGGSDA